MAYDIGPFDDGGHQGAKRLLALASYLETVSDRDYDHQTWRTQRGARTWAMCALGHGVSALPDVIGLRWREPDSADIVRRDGSGITEQVLTLAAEAFELTPEEAATIFGIGLYTRAFYGAPSIAEIKPKAAAAAIRAFACAKMAASSSVSAAA